MRLKGRIGFTNLVGKWRRRVPLRGLLSDALATLNSWLLPLFNAYKERVEATTPDIDNVTFNYRGAPVTYSIITSSTGRKWLDRDLGASRQAISKTDSDAYGHLFQFGRPDDGHQIPTSNATGTLWDGDVPDHGDFIITSDPPFSWQVTPNYDLWQPPDYPNMPGPAGYWRVPTQEEWQAEIDSWGEENDFSDRAFDNLKLTLSGVRGTADGNVSGQATFFTYTSYSPTEGVPNRRGFYHNINWESYGWPEYTFGDYVNAKPMRLILDEDAKGKIIDENDCKDSFLLARKIWDNVVFYISSRAGFLINKILGDNHVQTAFDMSDQENDANQGTASHQPALLPVGMEFDDGWLDTTLKISTQQFTAAAWVKINTLVNGWIVSQWQDTHTGRYMLHEDGTAVAFFLGSTVAQFTPQKNMWYFLSTTRGADDLCSFHRDKDLVGTATISYALPDVTVQIGGTDRLADRNTESTVDDIIVVSKELSTAEREAIYDDTTAKYPTVTSVVDPADSAVVSISNEFAAHNDTVTITISDYSASEFDSITVEGTSGVVTTTQVTAGAEYTFTMPSERVVVTVETTAVEPEGIFDDTFDETFN